LGGVDHFGIFGQYFVQQDAVDLGVGVRHAVGKYDQPIVEVSGD
jgi:hypothetical protein